MTRPGLHAVGGVAGLHLNVKDTGARSWIFRVKIGDRRTDLGLGGFPDVTLDEARAEARKIRAKIREGIDPLAARQAAQDALRAAVAKRLTFDQAALQCWRARSPEYRNGKHVLRSSSARSSLPMADYELALRRRGATLVHWTVRAVGFAVTEGTYQDAGRQLCIAGRRRTRDHRPRMRASERRRRTGLADQDEGAREPFDHAMERGNEGPAPRCFQSRPIVRAATRQRAPAERMPDRS